MEVLACLHHSLACESPQEIEAIVNESLSLLTRVELKRFSGRATTQFLMVLCGLITFNLANTAIAQDLQRGDTGSDVQDLQYALSEKGYFKGPFTGYFGTATEEAIAAFQRDQSILSDGVAGTQTLAALDESSSTAATASKDTTSKESSANTALLKFGSTGPTVRQLQADLARAGYYSASNPSTDYYGELTRAAVLEFQADHGLAQDGIVGPLTRAALAQGLQQASSAQTNNDVVLVGTTSSTLSLLKFGMTGNSVKQLQQDLATAGYYNASGPFTDYFGELTESAVKELQMAYGLKPDGVVGTATQSALTTAKTSGVATAPAENTASSAAPAENTASSASSQSATLLRYGSTGASVKQLQYDLASAGVYDSSNPFTDYFGELTEDAVYRLQAKAGISQDGVVGSETRQALSAAIAQNGSTPYSTSSSTSIASRQKDQPLEGTPLQLDLERSPSASATTPSASAPTASGITPLPTPVGYIRLNTDLAAFSTPNGEPINYVLDAGQVVGYLENRGDGWIRVEVPGNQGSWIFAGADYGNVEFASPDGSAPESAPAPAATSPTAEATDAAPSPVAEGWQTDINQFLNETGIEPNATPSPSVAPSPSESPAEGTSQTEDTPLDFTSDEMPTPDTPSDADDSMVQAAERDLHQLIRLGFVAG